MGYYNNIQLVSKLVIKSGRTRRPRHNIAHITSGQTGIKEDRQTAGHQDSSLRGQKDTKTGGQEDSRTEGQKGNMTAGLEDRKQEEKEVGGPEGLRKRGHKTGG